ncbi:MAG: hypothetical protein PHI47_03055 [Sulfuricurvum sp.]|uniref:hypothetical protein n=1 Tax=Sulfuricurvum sp. TaxID=2025608 RepID=UPI002637AFC3|nr:hypothetical protein [Sulfuricurvum sp.]MDD5159005.1 hypothetical protein [Sulfuricurvum sp.]
MDFSGDAAMKRFAFLRRTRKALYLLLGIVILLYVLLFTPWGNRLMTPIFEKALSSALSSPIALREFSLRHNRFHMIVQDTYGNTLSTQGGFSLLTLRLYAHYRLECFQEGGMNPIAVAFKTDGALSGGIAAFNIRGNGSIFGGNVLYQLELHRFHLAILDVKLHNIAYEPFLHLLDYPSLTDTAISGEISLRGFDRRDVEGNIHLTSKTHRFTPTPIKEDDNESFDLKSLLADKYGRIKPFNVNINLDTSLAHAGILEQFVGIPLGGAVELNTTLRGNEKLLHLRAHTGVAQSDTSLVVTIPDLEPSSVSFNFKHANMEQTFALFALNAPILGQGDVYGELNLTGGNLNVSITKGTTIPTVLRNEYQITQPLIHFNADVHADIAEKGVHYHGSFKSDLSRMEIDNTTTHDQMLAELLKTLR